jgi:hypothetical protein
MPFTVLETYAKLKNTDFRAFDKPQKNKGARGQLIELALGIPNSSNLIDLVDGELKSFTLGQSICVTQVQHCLTEIIEDSVSFKDSKVGQKLCQTIYVAFSKGNDYLGTSLVTEETHPWHHNQLEEDYNYICDGIRSRFETDTVLNTITGPNGILQIRTKASKKSDGTYTPLVFCGHYLKDKGMAFYLRGQFGKQLVK